MSQDLLHTAREHFNNTLNSEAWSGFVEFSRLNHLTEVVGLDGALNEDLIESDPDDNDDEYWEQVYWSESSLSGLYKTSEFVLANMKSVEKFNFLAVIIEPVQDCKNIILEDYDFLGYELLDLYFETSALTNCGGFDETFLPGDLNSFGLINDFDKAYDIANRLYENNPEEDHANTNVIAIWRHKYIGK
jgi:hypothetical protein